MNFILLAVEGDGTTPGIEDVQKWFDVAKTYVAERGVDWLVNITAAVVILIVGRWISRMLRGWILRLLGKAQVDETLSKFLANIGYALMLVFVFMAALNRLGVDTMSFAAVVAAAGLAIGLALQGSLSNFAAGVMIILFRPFKVGDFVEAGGTSGVVEEIHIFHTIMRSGDNRQIIVPNSAVNGGIVTNYSTKPTRRIDLVIGCGYNDDLRQVKAFLEEIVSSDDRILKDPAPVVAVNELGESSVDLVVRPWVNAADYWAVKWDLTEGIKLGFDDRGFTIPFPSRDVYTHQEMT